MSVLTAYFDKDVNQCSPIQPDYRRVVNYDEDGNEFITYELVDYPSLQAANGTVDNWSLESLLRAGIDPAFGIHTGLPTRIEGIDAISAADLYAATLLGEDDSKTEE